MVASSSICFKTELHRQRLQQPISLGLGRPFVSPKKARPKKTAHIPFGFSVAQKAGLSRLKRLLEQEPPSSSGSHLHDQPNQLGNDPGTILSDEADPNAAVLPDDPPLTPSAPSPSSTPNSESGKAKPGKVKAEDATQTLYDRWSGLIPSLADPFLSYQRSTYQQDIPNIPDTLCCCSKPNQCSFSYAKVNCLLQHRKLSLRYQDD